MGLKILLQYMKSEGLVKETAALGFERQKEFYTIPGVETLLYSIE
jgi:hypothetical protein